MFKYTLEMVFNEATYPEVTFVPPKNYPHIRSAFRAKGKHITISGPSGSGKSTLVQRLLHDFQIPISNILPINGRSYPQVESFFHILGTELGTEPVFSVLTSYLQLVDFVIIDDFHHLSSGARGELAKNLKLWHENQVRFIIIGIASSAADLVGIDAELGIRNDPFELKTQDEKFVRDLISLGEQALNVSFSENLKKEIVSASNGVPSVVQTICRTICVNAGIEMTIEDNILQVDLKLKHLKEEILRVFTAKYFNKVVGLAKGKQQARSVHNTYFDIIAAIATDQRSEIPTEFLYAKIVGTISDAKQRSRKATSFYNCLNNLNDVIEEKGMNDILLYSKGAKYIAIEDPSFRFYLNLIDMDNVKSKVHIRYENYPYDVAVSFAGDVRSIVVEFIQAAKKKGLTLFYDFDEQAQLWGQDLRKKLAEVYSSDALYMVVFLSESYPEKDWTTFELAIGKNTSEKRTSEYLLPVRVDDVNVVGISETVCCLDIRQLSIEEIVDILAQKIEQSMK